MSVRHLVATLLLACAASASHAQQAVPVGVIVAERQAVSKGAEFVGRVNAIERVDVRARVTGFLDAVLFTEGAIVAAGAKLFHIDPAEFEAAVQQARGDLLRAQGQFANANAQLQRTEELVRSDAASRATRDTRQADVTNSQGSIVVADAALKRAQLNLDYTSITSPIAGRIGRSAVTKGNVVGPDSGVLATVVSENPIYVTFQVSQRQYLDVQRAAGTTPTPDKLTVRLRFSDGTEYPEPGKINFVDVTVDRATDTVAVRAVFPNPKFLLVDGQFARVRVEGDEPAQRVLLPQSALLLDQEGAYVMLVEGGKAVVRRLKLGGEVGRNTIVEDGLKGGEQVIVTGLQALRPGQAVSAAPAPRS